MRGKTLPGVSRLGMGLWIGSKQNPDWILGHEAGAAHMLCSAPASPLTQAHG